MVDEMRDRTALVTGGTSGIGLAVARRFVAEGAHVIVTGRRQQGLDAVMAELGDRVSAVQADASEPDELAAVFAVVAARGRGLDAVHVNAGGGAFAPLTEVSPEDIDAAFATNVRGAILTIQKSVPHLSRGGAIVVTGSTAAPGGTPNFGLYGASKAALRSLSRTWAAELAPHGIRVNEVVPGPTETPGLAGLAPGNAAALLERLAEEIPLRRLIGADEIAGAVLFLVSDASAAMTGTAMFIDGGESIS